MQRQDPSNSSNNLDENDFVIVEKNHFDSLPAEILINIFLHLPFRLMGLANLLLVSKQFTKLIQTYYGRQQTETNHQKVILKNVLGIHQDYQLTICGLLKEQSKLSEITDSLSHEISNAFRVNVITRNYEKEFDCGFISDASFFRNNKKPIHIFWLDNRRSVSAIDIARGHYDYHDYICCGTETIQGLMESNTNIPFMRFENQEHFIKHYFDAVVFYFQNINGISQFCFNTIIEINQHISTLETEITKKMQNKNNFLTNKIVEQQLELQNKKRLLLSGYKELLQHVLQLSDIRNVDDKWKPLLDFKIDATLINANSNTEKLISKIKAKFEGFDLAPKSDEKEKCSVM